MAVALRLIVVWLLISMTSSAMAQVKSFDQCLRDIRTTAGERGVSDQMAASLPVTASPKSS